MQGVTGQQGVLVGHRLAYPEDLGEDKIGQEGCRVVQVSIKSIPSTQIWCDPGPPPAVHRA